MRFNDKTDAQIETWIRNYEKEKATDQPFYRDLLEERARRSQARQKLDFEVSLLHLRSAAERQEFTSYGELALASGVPWNQARHQMNGTNGHLDQLLDICHARGLPLLTAICVNQSNVESGKLGDDALAGFVAGARRLGVAVADPEAFHEESASECFRWALEPESQNDQ